METLEEHYLPSSALPDAALVILPLLTVIIALYPITTATAQLSPLTTQFDT